MASRDRARALDPRPLDPEHAPDERAGVLERSFAIDERSLAAFRIALGTLLVADLATRAVDLDAHYGDAGVLPREAFRRLFASSPWHWSLHLATGSVAGEAALFALAFAAAVLLVVGYRTRIATVVSWLLLLSLQARNPMLLYGADQLLRLLLFWSLFLPLGAVWSLDARRRPPERPRRHCSIATAALLLQPALMYVCSGALKLNPAWQSGAALAHALASDMFATPLGHRLLAHPELLARLTPVIPWFEIVVPIGLFAPLVRRLALGLLVGFHGTIGLLFATGAFPYTALTALLPFVPSGTWDRVARTPASRRIRMRFAARRSPSTDCGARRGACPPRGGRRVARDAVVAAALAYVVVWNLAGFGLEAYSRTHSLAWAREWWAAGRTGLPLMFRDDVVERRLGAFGWIGRVAGLHQRWDMFYRTSAEERGWHVVLATLADGRTVSVLEGGRSVAADALRRPASTLALYPTTRWATYFAYLRTPGVEPARRLLPPVVARAWAKRHPDLPIERLRIVFVQEPPPNGAGARREAVWYDGPPFATTPDE